MHTLEWKTNDLKLAYQLQIKINIFTNDIDAISIWILLWTRLIVSTIYAHSLTMPNTYLREKYECVLWSPILWFGWIP